MTRWKGPVGSFLLVTGVLVAASFGARNGAQHQEYRMALGEASALEAGPAHDEAMAEAKAIGLPEGRERMRQWAAVGLAGWGGGIALIVVGGLLARRQIWEDNRGHGGGGIARVDYVKGVEAALVRLRAVQVTLADLAMDGESEATRLELDTIQSDLFDPLVDGRGQLMARHGMGGFAEYFGSFSAGERNMARCWSALTDGHSVAAREAIDLSITALEASLAQFAVVDQRG